MTRYPISYQNGGKMDTLFMTKTAEKPYHLGPTNLYSPYKGVPPPGGAEGRGPETGRIQLLLLRLTHTNHLEGPCFDVPDKKSAILTKQKGHSFHGLKTVS